jgi:hypothetical protein
MQKGRNCRQKNPKRKNLLWLHELAKVRFCFMGQTDRRKMPKMRVFNCKNQVGKGKMLKS